MLMRWLLVAMTVTLVTAAYAEVLTLNDATFTDKVNEMDSLWFVKFCVVWCKHCARAGSLWEELGRAMDMEDAVEIAQLDCTTSKLTCTKTGIRSYPTLRLYHNGEIYKNYTGQRDLEGLKKFVLDAISEISAAEDANVDTH